MKEVEFSSHVSYDIEVMLSEYEQSFHGSILKWVLRDYKKYYYGYLYICDPKKCPFCKRYGCHHGYCYHTRNEEQRARGIKRLIYFCEFVFYDYSHRLRARRERKRRE